MDVYDFDNTIYDGESIIDFLIFIVQKKKSMIVYAPLFIYTTFLYKTNNLSTVKLDKVTNKMSKEVIKNKDLADSYVKEFWTLNKYKLKSSFLNKINENDVIVTASPRFLIEGIKDELKTKNIICSEYNIDKGQFEFICLRQNKVTKFNEVFPNKEIKNFYTDSMNDKPFMEIADNSYLVRKDKIKKLVK